MGIKRANTIQETKPTAKAEQMPTFTIDGNEVGIFNEAVKALKLAEGSALASKVSVLEIGLRLYRKHNVGAIAPATSIKIVDADGATCRLTSQNKYSAADAEAADSLFESLGADAGNYMHETVTASFDTDVFNSGPDGRFSEEVFNAYALAVEEVTRQLSQEGVLPTNAVSPLITTKKVLPLPDFDKRRWKDFDVTANRKISEVLKNTITLTPL